MSIRHWKPALNRFMIDFEECITGLYLTMAVAQKYLYTQNELIIINSINLL